MAATISLESIPGLEARTPSLPGEDFAAIGSLLPGARKIAILDDDPTGTQTVHGLDVLTEWSVPSLTAALRDPRPAFFILTNSRALPEPEARALNVAIAANLRSASALARQSYSIVSRSDSTLRGHFAVEIDALVAGSPEPVDAVIVAPAFFEGGRYTIDDIHYVAERERLVPAAETEFARDATFGYRNSDLKHWIEEKTAGRVRASDVVTFTLEQLRRDGAGAVEAELRRLQDGRYAVVNAASYRDLEIFVHGLLRAERAGKRFLFRTAASFVRVRCGLSARPLLRAEDIRSAGSNGGLIVVGSYVNKTTEQLRLALTAPGVRGIEADVERFGAESTLRAEVDRVARAAEQAIAAGEHALVYTTRNRVNALGRAGDLGVGTIVSHALVDVVRGISVAPSFVIAKGGITSSDIAVKALGVRKARVLGQAAAGVPVWQLAEDSLRPGLTYVVFPGNVGTPQTLRDLITNLTHARGP